MSGVPSSACALPVLLRSFPMTLTVQLNPRADLALPPRKSAVPATKPCANPARAPQTGGHRHRTIGHEAPVLMGVRLRAAIADDLLDLVDVEASATTRYYEAGFDRSLVQPRSEFDLRELLADTVVYVAEGEAADSLAGYV